jgi:CBS domain containing-hemolysin-like protein
LAGLKVKDLMVPLSDYAKVPDNATLQDAIKALMNARAEADPANGKQRGILITNRKGKVIGKVSLLDVLKALEPKYEKVEDQKALSRVGLSSSYMKSMAAKYKLWDEPLEDLCKKASGIIVKNIMRFPTEGEFVDESTSINEGIHQIVMGRRQSLLVTKGDEIVGVLRLTDIFREIGKRITDCGRE